MPELNRPVCVVAGGSAGIGRAVAERFASEGYAIAVLAREPKRVGDAAHEIGEAYATETLGIPCDVIDQAQVEAAAGRIDNTFGRIDVWVNAAMLTVIAPFEEMGGDEFEQVVKGTFLGTVNGTRAALSRMKEQGRGNIVNVGSALAYRAIPLQTAYCSAKHATNGFTQALRSELIHDGFDDIHLSLVQLPGVNTPQFDWARNKIDAHPRPAPPVYQPEVAADGVWEAVRRNAREIFVGRVTPQFIFGNMLAPAALDRQLASQGYSGQKADDLANRGHPDGNLFEAVEGDYAAHGSFDDEAEASGMVVDGDNARMAFFGGLGLAALAVGMGLGAWMAGGRFRSDERRRHALQRDYAEIGYEDGNDVKGLD